MFLLLSKLNRFYYVRGALLFFAMLTSKNVTNVNPRHSPSPPPIMPMRSTAWRREVGIISCAGHLLAYPANIAPLLPRSGAAERWIRRGGTKAKLTRRAGPSCLTAAPLRGLSVSPLRCSNGASQRSFHVAPLRLKEEAPSAQRSGV